jgi:hypothetical protein
MMVEGACQVRSVALIGYRKGAGIASSGGFAVRSTGFLGGQNDEDREVLS